MKELLLRNLLILYLGVSLRFLFYKIIKRRDVDFQRLLHGIKCPKNKNDEIFNYKNDFTNRLYAGKSSVSCPLKPSDSAPLC